MVVETEDLGDGFVPHHGHAHAVGHAPVFIGSILEQCPSTLLQLFGRLNDPQVWQLSERFTERDGESTLIDAAESIATFDQHE